MEHIISKDKGTKETSEPFYKVIIDFMGGDADYYKDEEVIIDGDDFEEAKPFLVALETMQHAYPRGRGGCHSHKGVIEYDLFFTEDPLGDIEEDFFDEKAYKGFELTEEERKDFDTVEKKFEEYKEELNPLEIFVQIPIDNYGGQYSFYGYSIAYIDEKRYEHEVKLIFSEEEKKRFDEMKTLLDI